MIWHLLVVQSHPDRVPREHRRAFFHELSRFYRHYHDQTSPMPSGRLDRIRHDLIAADRFRPMRGLRLARSGLDRAGQLARAGWRTGRSMARSAGARAAETLGQAYYHVQRRLPTGRPSGRLRGLLVPRGSLQPGRHLPGPRARPRPCAGSGSSTAPTQRAARRRVARGGRHAGILPRAGPGPVPDQQRELPRLRGQTPRLGAPADPPRHTGQGDGPGPGCVPHRGAGHESARPDAPLRPVGLQPQLERAQHRGVGPRLPVPLRDAGVRLPPQRPAGPGRRRTRSSPPGPSSARMRQHGGALRANRTASTRPSRRTCSTPADLADALGPDVLLLVRVALLLRPGTAAADPSGACTM